MSDCGDTILIVDDTLASLRLLASILAGAGYQVRPADSGELALASVAIKTPELILLDIDMPVMGGLDVCRRLKADARFRDIPVVFISALNDMHDKVVAFNAGGQDYITKPFQAEEVLARVGIHLKLRHLRSELEKHNRLLEERVGEQVREISDSQTATIVALAKLAESRDDDTGSHIERVQSVCGIVGGALLEHERGLDERMVGLISSASPLHDIGKVGIPDSVLLKPGRLTPEEFEVIKGHTVLGARTLEAVHRVYPRNEFLRVGLDIAMNHHERWDGGGYPAGLTGQAIPLSARIVAVADVYDALRSKRPYKEPWSHERARDTILTESGRQFDPAVVGAFQAVEAGCAEIRAKLGE